MIDRTPVFFGAVLTLIVAVSSAAAQPPSLPFAALAVGVGADPAAAPLAFVGVTTANGFIPSNNPPLQTLVGAATLALMGHTAAPPLTAAALVKAGDHLGCWLLVADDPFNHIPQKPSPLPDPNTRADEYRATTQILLQAAQNNPEAFHTSAVANDGVTYAMLFERPDVHRGKAIHIQGYVQWIRKLDTPPLLKNAGLNDLYEVWILNPLAGDAPYCVLLTHLPADLPLDKRLNVRVELDGYFVKRRWEENKEAVPVKAWTQSLLIAARTLTRQEIPPTVTAQGRILTGSATLLMSGAAPPGVAALHELALLRRRAGRLLDAGQQRPGAADPQGDISENQGRQNAAGRRHRRHRIRCAARSAGADVADIAASVRESGPQGFEFRAVVSRSGRLSRRRGAYRGPAAAGAALGPAADGATPGCR